MDRAIDRALEAGTPALMEIPGVIGTGAGEEGGRPVILVLVARRTPEIDRRVPRSLDGFPIVIREIGPIRPIEET